MAHARYDAVADFYVQGLDAADGPASLALPDLPGPVTGLRVLRPAAGGRDRPEHPDVPL
jgi:hypothetical protein